ncbi:unnamed protein product [Owenia fusiformis]|uniref:Uncharacterized protein n=1 Tax=Owenia fusiformis TaxID=6347 RepID=A0A8J1US68_OWEFU|nr:unnamed protein product [Owenia fusiformis]
MGALNSKTFADMIEETDSTSSPEQARKILDHDPRSPTCLFSRTPIQVEKTPVSEDPRSPSLGIMRTPLAPNTEAFDPRSPSVEFARTPLSVDKMLDDPRSPNEEIVRTPLVEKFTYLNDTLSPVKFDISCTNDDTTHELSKSPSPVGPISTSPVTSSTMKKAATAETELFTESFETMNRSFSEPDLTNDDQFLIKAKPEKKASSAKKSPLSSSTKSNKAKPKVLFKSASTPSKMKEKLLWCKVADKMKDNTRSPLGLRNMDNASPRMLVQRKQVNNLNMRKLGSFDSPSKYEAFGDKENIGAQ